MFEGVDPKVDYAFKHLFGREANIPLLIDLIDSVLKPAPGCSIESLEILNPFNPKEAFDDKLSILDIKARDKGGRQFDVEMQMLGQRFYDKRIVYYASVFHQQQLHETQPYDVLRPTISISFVDHAMFPQTADYHLHFQLLEKVHHFPLSDALEFHILQLPRFLKSPEELIDGLDHWLYFLRNADKMNMAALPSAMGKPMLIRALEDLNMLTQTEVEREQYHARLKGMRDYNTNMIGREFLLEEGRREGLKEGRDLERRNGAMREIRDFEDLLRRPATPTDQLTSLSTSELAQLRDKLFGELRNSRIGN